MKQTTLIPIWCAALLTVCGAVAADPPASTSSAPTAQTPMPRIDFDSTTYNFGRAKSGETLKHDFIFTNSGNAILEITDVKPGCGCTTAGTWDKKVEPGKTGVIPLQFNSTGFGGQVAKSAVITCNDPARTNLFLQISGTVWKPIDITPQMAMFNISGEAPANQTQVLRVINNLEEPVTLSDLQCNSASFRTELAEIKPGREFELRVTAIPPFTNATAFSTITLKTSSTNAPSLSVSAYATVQQAVTVSPQQLTLPPGPLKATLNTTVLVRNNSTNSLEVSEVMLNLQGVDLKVTQPQTGRLYSITMTFPSGFEVPSGQKPELKMRSNHPKFTEIKVPVVQMKAAATTSAAAPSIPAPGVLQTASPARPPAPLAASLPSVPGK